MDDAAEFNEELASRRSPNYAEQLRQENNDYWRELGNRLTMDQFAIAVARAAELLEAQRLREKIEFN